LPYKKKIDISSSFLMKGKFSFPLTNSWMR
jgi:hypothetical protein